MKNKEGAKNNNKKKKTDEMVWEAVMREGRMEGSQVREEGTKEKFA